MKFSGGCAALGSTSLLSQLLSLELTGAAYAASGQTSNSGYKALVCVFLNGGMDSFDMLTPYEDAEHSIYSGVRLFAARRKTGGSGTNPNLLPIFAQGGSGRRLGINGLMPELKTLYDQGDLAFLANVGCLIDPMTKSTYNSTQSRRPLGLFSHSDHLQHWQTSVPQSRSQATGWGGRMADLLATQHNLSSKVSMNISLGDMNLFQTGSRVLPYVVGSSGATRVDGYRFISEPVASTNYDRVQNRVINGVNAAGLNAMYPTADTASGALYSNLLQRTLSLRKRASLDIANVFNDAVSSNSTTGGAGTSNLPTAAQNAFDSIANDTAIPNRLKNFASQLNMVARVIQARNAPGFGQTRQIFFVQLGGWDHHDNITSQMATMMPGLSKGLKAFYDATVAMGVKNDVVTFTASDFGRTLNPNSSGTDHAWGGNQIVMGGSVAGGKVYGNYPTSLAANGPLDLGRGRLIPTTSVDAYNAELALWFGVRNNSQLTDILPNVRNFYSAGASSMPLGMLRAG
jgi:uncharacterized protein (DUF1501 family)